MNKNRQNLASAVTVFVISQLFPSPAALAMPIKTEMIKPRAFFVEAENNLLEPLDLKAKTLSFSKAEFDKCGAGLVRKAQTLTYSCTLEIPSTAKISRLQNLVTPAKLDILFGSTKRQVQVLVAPDARHLTVSTTFDKTGIDFEVSKFNDDFFSIYAKVAQLVLSEALNKQNIRLEVLESR
jgi:hypothetical protein